MRYIIQPDIRKSVIHKEIYGHFAEHLGRCIYDGLYVGKQSDIPNQDGIRLDVADALKRMRIPVLRWPGGCFADAYHWEDGIGAQRPFRRNAAWLQSESNAFGTHEYFELCRMIGCEPYVNGNVGSGSVREMAEWVEYMNSDAESPLTALRCKNGDAAPFGVKYFAVGNENWGGGGSMTPEFYADVYRWYQTALRPYGGHELYKIACGTGQYPGGPSHEWTRIMMEKAAPFMDGLSLHYYTWPYTYGNAKGRAVCFDDKEYYTTLAKAYDMERLVRQHSGIMDLYDPERRVGLIVDEWGTWYDPEPECAASALYQYNTMRDAMVAALTLHIFNKHSERVRMANLAQLVNVLQSVILTEEEKMVLTPTYHVFEMLASHQGGTLVESGVACDCFEEAGIRTPYVSESASVSEDGLLTVSIANLDMHEAQALKMRIDGRHALLTESRILTGDAHAQNTFDMPATVQPEPLEGVASRFDEQSTEIELSLPPCSVCVLRFQTTTANAT